LALICVEDADSAWSKHPHDDLQRAEEAINQALALESRMAAAHRVTAIVLTCRNQLPEAIAATETSLALNQNDSASHAHLARFELLAGRPERGWRLSTRAMRLSPRDPNLWVFLLHLGRTQFALGQIEAAVASQRKAITANADVNYLRVFLAAGYGRKAHVAQHVFVQHQQPVLRAIARHPTHAPIPQLPQPSPGRRSGLACRCARRGERRRAGVVALRDDPAGLRHASRAETNRSRDGRASRGPCPSDWHTSRQADIFVCSPLAAGGLSDSTVDVE
jgi:tetratricopeptide (TPR) repeat protein